MKNGFYIPEKGHYAPLLLPQDLQGSARASTVIRMKNYDHADIFVYIGASTRAAGIITLESCSNMTPTVHTELAFNYYVSTAVFGAASDDIWMDVTKLTATTGIVPGAVGPAAATTGVTYCIQLESSMLTTGHVGFRLSMADPGAASIGCAWAILSGSRYSADVSTADV
jgi:hypothetical protein